MMHVCLLQQPELCSTCSLVKQLQAASSMSNDKRRKRQLQQLKGRFACDVLCISFPCVTLEMPCRY
jgi:hypothetical protein